MFFMVDFFQYNFSDSRKINDMNLMTKIYIFSIEERKEFFTENNNTNNSNNNNNKQIKGHKYTCRGKRKQ